MAIRRAPRTQSRLPLDRACKTCRARRVKCDARRPTCPNCERQGRTCLGYDTQCVEYFDLPTFDEGDSERRIVNTILAKDLTIVQPRMSSQRLQASPTSFADRLSTQLVYECQRVWRGRLWWIGHVCRQLDETNAPELVAAAKALVAGSVGETVVAGSLVGLNSYARCCRLLHNLPLKRESSLLAILLLSLCEVLKRDISSEYGLHIGALVSIILSDPHSRRCGIEALSVALALKDGPKVSDDIYVRSSIRAFLKTRLAYVIRIEHDEVRIVHQSFRDFLVLCQEVSVGDQILRNVFFLPRSREEGKLAVDCLTYIALEDFIDEQDSIEKDEDCWNQRLVLGHRLRYQFGFLRYATEYWPIHAGETSQNEPEAVWKGFKRIVASPANYKVMCAGYGITQYFNPPVFVAFRLGLDYLVEKLISDGHSINEIDEGDMHIIHSRSRGILSLDNRYGPNADVPASDKDIDVLLSFGADINGRDCRAQTILHRLVTTSSLSRVKTWLRRPFVDVNARDWNGQTILHRAINVPGEPGDLLVDAILAEEAVNVNILDMFGMSALTLTTKWGSQRMLQRLLRCPRVDIFRATYQGESLLINVARQGRAGLLISLLERLQSVESFRDPDIRSILHWTVMMSMTTALRIALTKQSDIINVADYCGMTALHYAVYEGDLEATMLLMRSGANPALKNKLNESVLHLAALRGHGTIFKKFVQILPKYMVNERDFMGYTAIHKAVVSGNDGLVEYLARLPFTDWTKKDRHGKTPLMFSTAFGTIRNLTAILPRSEVQRDAFGNTLLHHAVSAANDAVVEYLLQHKQLWINDHADRERKGLNTLNAWGYTALDRLPTGSHIQRRLEEAGLVHSEIWKIQQAHLPIENLALKSDSRDLDDKDYSSWVLYHDRRGLPHETQLTSLASSLCMSSPAHE